MVQVERDAILRQQMVGEQIREMEGYEVYDKRSKTYKTIKIPLL